MSESLCPEALRLGPRALPGLPSHLDRGGQEQARVACDPSGLGPRLLEQLRSTPGLRVQPFVPPGATTDFSPTEVTIEAPVDLLEELSEPHPELSLLLQAHRALVSPPALPRIMGVLNVTPDSFSDGGRYLEPEKAVEHGLKLVQEGAHMVDVGGESTRPGAVAVPVEEESRRIVPVVTALAREGVPVSIDTRRSKVARAALENGAVMINDVSGGLFDPEMIPLAAASGCELVLMHAQGDPSTMQVAPQYSDPVREVASFLRQRGHAALEAGLEPGRLLLDPGIGFGKRLEHNLALLRRLPELRSLGSPLLLGVSRKSFIGHLTGAEQQDAWRSAERRDRPEERLGGTAAALAACVAGGAEVLRVHDVGIMAEAIQIAVALRG